MARKKTEKKEITEKKTEISVSDEENKEIKKEQKIEQIFCKGRVCIKKSGTGNGKICVILDAKNKDVTIILDNKKKKGNLSHLIPLARKLDTSKDISSKELQKIMQEEGFSIREKKKFERKEKIKEEKKK